VNSQIIISSEYRDLLKSLALETSEQVFSDPRLRVWRDLEDRDNSTLDATLPGGRAIRLHVKRDKGKRREPMSLEAAGIMLLGDAGVSSAPLVAHGFLGERTFVITENLDGYSSADRLMETGAPRLPIFRAMAGLAARLHKSGLHHRDLYANHFYLRPSEHGGYDVRLIDSARVKRLPRWFRERWIVKDVAQLLFSVRQYATTEESKELLRDYMSETGREADVWFQNRVNSKARSIERHDHALREKNPSRNLRLQDGN
jgi:tRNA A-37 threonylcarbamoyl transferase component Bud32